MSIIRTYRHTPNVATDAAGTVVDTETEDLVATSGDISVSVDTTGWDAGTYEITITRQDDGESESPHSTTALPITVNSASGDRIWPLNPTPGTPNGVETRGTFDPVLGTSFTSDVNGNVNGVWFWRSASNASNLTAARAHLWAVTGQVDLGGVDVPLTGSGGWEYIAFAAPIAITAGTTYVATLGLARAAAGNLYFGKETGLSGYFPRVSGHLTATTANMRYGTGINNYPNNDDTGLTAVYVDVEFQPA